MSGLVSAEVVHHTETNQQRSEALEYLVRHHVEWAEDPLLVLEAMYWRWSD